MPSQRFPGSILRWVVTYLDAPSRRLFGRMEGRNTFATREEAMERVTAFQQNQESVQKLAQMGIDTSTFAAQEVECWPGHHDPCGCYFPMLPGDAEGDTDEEEARDDDSDEEAE